MRIWRLAIQGMGVTSIILSVMGFCLLIDLLPRGLEPPSGTLSVETPYYRTVFIIMNVIEAAFLSAMIVVAIRLLRPSRLAVRAYTCLSICLVLYSYVPGFFWGPGPVGSSVAAASGVGQAVIGVLLYYPLGLLYFIVTVILANLAIWRLDKMRSTNVLDTAN